MCIKWDALVVFRTLRTAVSAGLVSDAVGYKKCLGCLQTDRRPPFKKQPVTLVMPARLAHRRGASTRKRTRNSCGGRHTTRTSDRELHLCNSTPASEARFLSEETWRQLFPLPDPPTPTFAVFLDVACVKLRSAKLVPLREYITRNRVGVDACEKLYTDAVVCRENYLRNVFRRSLRIPELNMEKNGMSLCTTALTRLTTTPCTKFKNVARNLYWRQILQTTKAAHDNTPSYLDVAQDLLCRLVIDYKLLTPSVVALAKTRRYTSMLTPLYFRASIMNPTLPYSIYSTVLHNPKKLFTPTLGWSSYLVGFMQHKQVEHYIGVDVIPSVCRGTHALARQYRPDMKTDVFCVPSEELARDRSFRRKFGSYCDGIFFSPPYFQLELYADGEQSTKRYSTLAQWLQMYWTPTVKLCHHVLQKGKPMCYIVSGYNHAQRSCRKPCEKTNVSLVELMHNVTIQCGFRPVGSYPIRGSNVHFTKHREHMETLCVYRKSA